MNDTFRRITALVLAASVVGFPLAAADDRGAEAGNEPESAVEAVHEGPSPLAETVREATRPFRRLPVAEAAGYGLLHGCVSGPLGAMGVHFAHGDLVSDAVLDARQPEVLMYEWRGGRARLVGVEFVVLADVWHAENEAPPVLEGQLFSYTGAPNRYGIPPFYSLHVWAWQHNPNGIFADWNRKVSCAEYSGLDD